MIEILQDREKKLNLRAALILAIARDLQECIDEEDIFSMDDVFDYYQAEEGVREVKNALAEVDYYTYSRKMFQNQYQMEHLRADWESYLQEAEKLLYRNVNEKIDKKQYVEIIQEVHAGWRKKCRNMKYSMNSSLYISSVPIFAVQYTMEKRLRKHRWLLSAPC